MLTKRDSIRQVDLLLLLILAAAAFLFFFRLDHRPFWQDEAETACLARNVLEYGIPKAFNGVNLVSQESCKEFNGDYIWRWSPWLQIYVTAGAFFLGGINTMAGRAPFALIGFATVWLVYFFIKRRFGDLTWARLAALLMASSVLFLLFSRQCRYYSLGAFLTLLAVYAFRENWQEQKGPAFVLLISLALLFQTNYLLFFSFGGALLLAALVVYRQDLPVWRTLILILGLILLVMPFLAFYRINQQTAMLNFFKAPRNLAFYSIDFFQFMLPLPVAVGLLWTLGRRNPRVLALPYDAEERFILSLFLLIFFNILILAWAPDYFIRYMIHLLPLCIIIMAWACCQIWRWHKLAGIVFILLIAATNWLYMFPVNINKIINRAAQKDPYMLISGNIPLRLYLTELFRPFPDVNQGLISFFLTHANPRDIILTNYCDLPLQFYTKNKVLGGLQGPVISPELSPKWVVRLKHFSYTSFSDRFININLPLNSDYQAIKLAYFDDRFGNRPDPYYHHFISPQEPYDHLIIYRKKNFNRR
jgi:4-amino-4-deoxy-L-arabinose transferase-like glycosyltransferase